MPSTLAAASGTSEHPSSFQPALIAGPILVGGLTSTLFVGCSLVFCHTYFRTFFKSDRLALKAAVVTVSIMDTMHFVLVTSLLYYCFIANWGSPLPFIYLKAHWAIHAFISSLTHIAVQSLFVYRVKQLTRKLYIWLPCLLFFGVRIVGLAALGFIIPTHSSSTVNQLTDGFSALGTTCLCFGVAGDLLVAGSLSYCLWMRSVPRSNSLATQVLIFVIQTGLLTSISSSVYLITLIVWPHDLIWAGISLIVPRVYSISLTTSLNHRKHLRKTALSRNQLSLWDSGDLERPRGEQQVDLEFAELGTAQISMSAPSIAISVVSGGSASQGDVAATAQRS